MDFVKLDCNDMIYHQGFFLIKIFSVKKIVL